VSLPTFVTSEPFSAGKQVTLGEEEAHHIRVRRLDVGTRVALLDGQGLRGTGTLVRIAKRNATVEVEAAEQESPRREVHLLLPIADKERMLWLAEKACELGIASWRPVQFRRSRSVAARGEGPMFTQKVAARMRSAMEQSGNAWLPAIFPEANVERAIAAAPVGVRIILDGAGVRMTYDAAGAAVGAVEVGASLDAPITVVVGPEGGIEDDEMEAFVAAGFTKISLGNTILRFETAAIAALGAIVALIDQPSKADTGSTHG
jgi:16S rRNA (uracil1498-N3)-methyltransferase